MQVSGKIIEIFDVNQISDSFKKREFVLEYAEKPEYPEFIKMEFIQDKCSLLDQCGIGDKVEVQFNLKGRKWTDKTGKVVYFNTLQAWRIEKKDEETSIASEKAPLEEPEWLDNKDEDNALPF